MVNVVRFHICMQRNMYRIDDAVMCLLLINQLATSALYTQFEAIDADVTRLYIRYRCRYAQS